MGGGFSEGLAGNSRAGCGAGGEGGVACLLAGCCGVVRERGFPLECCRLSKNGLLYVLYGV